MARQYSKQDAIAKLALHRKNRLTVARGISIGAFIVCLFSAGLSPTWMLIIGGLIPAVAVLGVSIMFAQARWIETERKKESARRGGKEVVGSPPNRKAFQEELERCRREGRVMIDRYLVGFELDSGDPIWVSDDDICTHGCVFAKTGVGKTLWLEGLMFQQMARGRASGFTFIDAKRDTGTLADIIMMCLMTGRMEDLVVVDPFDPVCAYNFVFTTQRADVKARKVLRCGLPPTSDQSTTKHYDRLAADAVYRVVRAMESLGLAWSVRDIAVALSAFTVAYPRMRNLLHEQGSKEAMIELGHLASSYRTAKGSLDSARLTDNLRGIASELHSISNSEAGEMFCAPRADLSLTDAILRGKLVYYMLPRLEEAESAARMVKVFREDLEVSIGEITSNRIYCLEDPHLVIVDEGASTFGPTWANLFELARKGRFALLFGAQSVGGLMDETMGLSEQFYERVLANVNLKVVMRIGDNRTAKDMCEWIGKVASTKTAISTGTSSSFSAREYTQNLELNRKSSDSIREGITLSDDEEDLVSAEELKHEMSSEKGLAWFDKGDGRVRKGRSLWFNGDLPSRWEGREYLTRYETVEADEIGLAEWVDEQILAVERAETERSLSFGNGNGNGGSHDKHSNGGGDDSARASSEQGAADTIEESGPFRFNLAKGFRGVGRANTFVGAPEQATPPAAAPEPAPQASPAVEPEKNYTVEKTTAQEAQQKATQPHNKAEASPRPPQQQQPRKPGNGGKPKHGPGRNQAQAAQPKPQQAKPQQPLAPEKVSEPQGPGNAKKQGGKLMFQGKQRDTVTGVNKN